MKKNKVELVFRLMMIATTVLCFQYIGMAQTKKTAGSFINVATYNLRYANHGDSVNGNGWGQRLPVIAQLIQFHDFDIFGTQEGLFQQLEGLRDSLPGYAYIGIGREDGVHAGETFSYILQGGNVQGIRQGKFLDV